MNFHGVRCVEHSLGPYVQTVLQYWLLTSYLHVLQEKNGRFGSGGFIVDAMAQYVIWYVGKRLVLQTFPIEGRGLRNPSKKTKYSEVSILRIFWSPAKST